jgi:hypothetical protein
MAEVKETKVEPGKKPITKDEQDIVDRQLDNKLKVVDVVTGTVLGKDKNGNTRSVVDVVTKVNKDLRKTKEQEFRHEMKKRKMDEKSQGKKKKKKK